MIVFLLCAVIVGIFAYELAVLKPKWVKVAAGLIPKTEIIMNAEILFNAIGILGATVMPHSLFLHSNKGREEDGTEVWGPGLLFL